MVLLGLADGCRVGELFPRDDSKSIRDTESLRDGDGNSPRRRRAREPGEHGSFPRRCWSGFPQDRVLGDAPAEPHVARYSRSICARPGWRSMISVFDSICPILYLVTPEALPH